MKNWFDDVLQVQHLNQAAKHVTFIMPVKISRLSPDRLYAIKWFSMEIPRALQRHDLLSVSKHCYGPWNKQSISTLKNKLNFRLLATELHSSL